MLYFSCLPWIGYPVQYSQYLPHLSHLYPLIRQISPFLLESSPWSFMNMPWRALACPKREWGYQAEKVKRGYDAAQLMKECPVGDFGDTGQTEFITDISPVWAAKWRPVSDRICNMAWVIVGICPANKVANPQPINVLWYQ